MDLIRSRVPVIIGTLVLLGIVGFFGAYQINLSSEEPISVSSGQEEEVIIDTASIEIENASSSVATSSPVAATSSKQATTSSSKVVTPAPKPTIPVAPNTAPTAIFIPGIEEYTKLVINGYWTLYATTTAARWPKVTEPSFHEINARALVALYCHGKDGKDDIWKGSGNIIHPKGYILTNRHVAADAVYCEVAMPKQGTVLPTRSELADLERNPSIDISGWRPYKAINYFVPEQSDNQTDEEKFATDFAIMKINAINDDCQTFSSCDPLPSVFPYNVTSNFGMPTSTAGEGFPVNIETTRGLTLWERPYEMLMYGYPANAGGGGSSHILRGNLGYAMAYIAGDKQYDEHPIMMLTRVLYSTYGGASGSGVFYKGNIVGLVYAGFSDIAVVQYVIPMPFISRVLNDNGKGWLLNPASSGE